MCHTCNGHGKQYEVHGSIIIVRPCSNCPLKDREQRKWTNRKRLMRLLANAEKHLERMG